MFLSFISRLNAIHIKRRLRKFFHKPIIYVFGDSHAAIFQHEIFVVQGVGPATAYRLSSEKSSVQAKKKIEEYISRFPKTKSKEYILFVFGEIDCRLHIYKAHKEKKISITRVVKNTVDAYGSFLLDFRKQYPQFDILIFNVLPTGEQENIYNHRFFAVRETRIRITREMNRELESFCKKHQMVFINIFQKLIDKKGNRLKRYMLDEVHFTPEVVKFVIEELREKRVLENSNFP